MLAVRDWAFKYTEMYMVLNHEIAPKDAAPACGACHVNAGGPGTFTDWKALGYDCEDPMMCAERR